MARLARVVVPGVPHPITQRGNRCQQTFLCDEDYHVTTRKRTERPASDFTLGCRILELYPHHLCTDLEVLHAA